MPKIKNSFADFFKIGVLFRSFLVSLPLSASFADHCSKIPSKTVEMANQTNHTVVGALTCS